MQTATSAMDALPIGKTVTVSKTVGETDVYLFAGISGDFAPNHVDEEFMKRTKYGRRIAHGALLVAYMSQASTKISRLRSSAQWASSRMTTSGPRRQAARTSAVHASRICARIRR